MYSFTTNADADHSICVSQEGPTESAKQNDFVYKPLGVHAGGTCDDGDIKRLLEYCPEAQMVIDNRCLND